MRIAIVNDVAFAVEAMRRVLTEDGKHQVAWTACDGAEAVRLCLIDRPDLILMDLIMPVMDGVEATRKIMAASPCAILIVTATIEGNAGRVFEAMGAGALDVAQTPTLFSQDSATSVSAFLYKIGALGALLGIQQSPLAATSSVRRAQRLLAIGSSAGGPVALTTVLAGLPKDLPAAVVIVQHVDAQFAPGLATWLADHSTLPVRAAASGDMLTDGVVYLAASNDHLVLESQHRLGYTPDPVQYAYRPSVNAFFESAARRWRGRLVAVVLTGMGGDGASGLKLLRSLGHHTIAQDQATSAVYGMPKACAEVGAAVEILPLDRIAKAAAARISG